MVFTRWIAGLGLVAAAACAAPASVAGDAALAAKGDLEAFVEAQLEVLRVPGLSVAVVDRDGLVWSGAFGWADVEQQIPVTRETRFHLASVSKTVTAAAILQAVERGTVDLDSPAGKWLPFPLAHPVHPDEPITLRRLLTHMGGIRDNWRIMDGLYVEGDSPWGLEAFLRSYLVPGGEHYDAGRNFHKGAPGTRHSYSNVGVMLAAYVVEAAAGVPFDSLSEESLLLPLGLPGVHWRLSAMDPAHLALPHDRSSDGDIRGLHHHGYPDYPAGTLRASAEELGVFARLVLSDGVLDGVRLMSAASVEEMHRVQFPRLDDDQALVFYWSDSPAGRVLGHDGGDPGVTTWMALHPESGVGAVILTNGDVRNERAASRLMARLLGVTRARAD